MNVGDILWKKFYVYNDYGTRLGTCTYRIGKISASYSEIRSVLYRYWGYSGSYKFWSEDALNEISNIMELGLQQVPIPNNIVINALISDVPYEVTYDVRNENTYINLLPYMPSLSLSEYPDYSIPDSGALDHWWCTEDDFNSPYAIRVGVARGDSGHIISLRANNVTTPITSGYGSAIGAVGNASLSGGTLSKTHLYFGLNCITSDNLFCGVKFWGLNQYANTDYGTLTENNSNIFISILENAESYNPNPPASDPYEPGGYSGTGGGGGGQNFTSTPIGRAPLPTLSFADTGFCRIYNPSLSQLRALANYMWTDDNFLQTIINHAKQLLEDPIEAIISLSLVPVPVPNGAAEDVKVLFISTGVSMPPVTNQFVEVDCGTLSLPVEDQYGAALDFNPYTKIDLYLPYIGQVSIDVDEVMYKTMHCMYRVDVVTGMCVAIISVGTGTDETVLYQFAGHCGVQMPLNSADFSGWVGAIVTAAKTIGGLAAAGAGGAGPAAALIGGPSPVSSKTTRITQGGGHNFQSSQTVRNPATGRQVTAGTMKAERVNLPEVTTSVHETTPASFGELAARGTANTVDAIIGSKMHFEHAGSFSGNSGYIAGVRRPYAILKRPRQCYPENYASYRGFPAMIYMNLGDCTGYTEVHDIHLTGISATNPELGELAQLLKTGVIL